MPETSVVDFCVTSYSYHRVFSGTSAFYSRIKPDSSETWIKANNMNVQDAAIQILKDAGKPLHAKEIAERIMEAGLWIAKGKTPEATVSARLYSDIKKHRDQSTFVKVAPQKFMNDNLKMTLMLGIYNNLSASHSDMTGRALNEGN